MMSSQDWNAPLVSSPLYTPPYVDAPQDEMAWHLVKYLRDDARLASDVEVEIPGALFTLDFLVTVTGPTPLRVAFEIGNARNLRDHGMRLRRDATLLAHGCVDCIYRVRSADVMQRMDDVLYIASIWDADVFSERGRINLRTLASPEARALDVRPEQPSVLVPYRAADAPPESPERHLWHVANGVAPHILVRRLSRDFESVWRPYADAPPVFS